jgi:hypothetical protein
VNLQQQACTAGTLTLHIHNVFVHSIMQQQQQQQQLVLHLLACVLCAFSSAILW